jgi:hypothetical protein
VTLAASHRPSPRDGCLHETTPTARSPGGGNRGRHRSDRCTPCVTFIQEAGTLRR